MTEEGRKLEVSLSSMTASMTRVSLTGSSIEGNGIDMQRTDAVASQPAWEDGGGPGVHLVFAQARLPVTDLWRWAHAIDVFLSMTMRSCGPDFGDVRGDRRYCRGREPPLQRSLSGFR